MNNNVDAGFLQGRQRATAVETRSIDYVPLSERHGRLGIRLPSGLQAVLSCTVWRPELLVSLWG